MIVESFMRYSPKTIRDHELRTGPIEWCPASGLQPATPVARSRPPGLLTPARDLWHGARARAGSRGRGQGAAP